MRLAFFILLILPSLFAHSQCELIAVYGPGTEKTIKWKHRDLDSIPCRIDSLFFCYNLGHHFKSYNCNEERIARGNFDPNDTISYLFKSFDERINLLSLDTVPLLSNFYFIMGSDGTFKMRLTEVDSQDYSSKRSADSPVLNKFGTEFIFTEPEIKLMSRD